MIYLPIFFILLMTSCIPEKKIDDASLPLIDRLQNTRWKVKDRNKDYEVIIRNKKIKIKLTGILGFTETPYIQRSMDTDFSLLSIYDNTESALLIGITLIDPYTIKLYAWPYTYDIPIHLAKQILNEDGQVFKRIR